LNALASRSFLVSGLCKAVSKLQCFSFLIMRCSICVFRREEAIKEAKKMQTESEERKLDQIKSMHGKMENKRRDEAKSKLKEVMITSSARIAHFLGRGLGFVSLFGPWTWLCFSFWAVDLALFLFLGRGLGFVSLGAQQSILRTRSTHPYTKRLAPKIGQRRDDSPPPRVGRVRSGGC
jgi:hypothetical protein